VQILASILGMIQTSVLCELVNVTFRMRLTTQALAVSALHFWISISQGRMDRNVRVRLIPPIVLWTSFLAVPAALWAGALAPVSVLALYEHNTTVAAYSNVSLIQHYYDSTTAPEAHNERGFFSYAMGGQYAGQLLETARSANTAHNRNHSKMDDTNYIFTGRSYGLGGSVGLFDNTAWPRNTESYTYRDIDYTTSMTCLYNNSNDLMIDYIGTAGYSEEYAIKGYLPNSDLNDDPVYTTYVGQYGYARIIAFNVAQYPVDQRRIMAIVAGDTYIDMDGVQCTADFKPTQFSVSISTTFKSITVTPVPQVGAVADIGAGSPMTNVVMLELSRIPSNLQGCDFSLVGQSLNTSITNYRASHQGATNDTSYNTLWALEGAFTAMIDDMLTAYGAAQYVIAGDTRSVAAQLQVHAIKMGQSDYFYAVFAVNILVLALVGVQAVLTRVWDDLPDFDCLDPASIVLASSRGGNAISTSVDALGRERVFVGLEREVGDRLVLDVARRP